MALKNIARDPSRPSGGNNIFIIGFKYHQHGAITVTKERPPLHYDLEVANKRRLCQLIPVFERDLLGISQGLIVTQQTQSVQSIKFHLR